MRLSLLAAMLCPVVVSVSVLLGCSGDRRESFYPVLADANKDGAITRGWIPDFLPDSSRSIHELHELSPSTEWCSFEFVPSDSQDFRKHLKTVDALPSSAKHVSRANASWWPPMLEGNLNVEQIRRSGFELYSVVGPETAVTTEVLLFTIDWTNGRAFFYRTRE
jgi:hypothetical protein